MQHIKYQQQRTNNMLYNIFHNLHTFISEYIRERRFVRAREKGKLPRHRDWKRTGSLIW